MHKVRIGCSGWNYRDWREDFYPAGTPAARWLSHYASVFDTVEVNATFYRLPERRTTRNWADQVPDDFAADVCALLEQHAASLALGDDARRPLPRASPVGPLAYLRLHYGRRGRDGNYSERELGGWRRRIAAWRAQRRVFVYLNNDWRGFAPRNAKTLRAGLS